ncbi:FMN-dependent NADH-azoreductase [Haloplasma contractile]|uniref:FMN dependent NADH:quinone oxidoreductase n=1 Tax=Haloplasma contractile SSD-17B TaxID=1033810 RepID=U2EBC3_9MOLU|nr:NAD(P)H-dependent oxidoreductase [Haloplasma contractile]ERJ12091.1 FMN-dependent NADH-azoreductase 2 protein [Haloplasma contractile SSD-17B]
MYRKILYIKANPKPEEDSYTFKLANEFLKYYKQENPDDQITELDLYKEGIKCLDQKMLKELSDKERNEMHRHALQFAKSDKYIIAAPMWNLSVPAILKAYFDYVSYAGITFKYTEKGPMGLLGDKPRRVMHIVSRGGQYSEGPYKAFEMGDEYVRTILGFMGIIKVETLALENTNVLNGNELHEKVREAYKEAKRMGKHF